MIGNNLPNRRNISNSLKIKKKKKKGLRSWGRIKLLKLGRWEKKESKRKKLWRWKNNKDSMKLWVDQLTILEKEETKREQKGKQRSRFTVNIVQKHMKRRSSLMRKIKKKESRILFAKWRKVRKKSLTMT